MAALFEQLKLKSLSPDVRLCDHWRAAPGFAFAAAAMT
jgi:hypothetical protein